MKPIDISLSSINPNDEVSHRSRMAIVIFVITSLAAGLVYAGKQFASREIVLTASHGKPATSSSVPRSLVDTSSAAATAPAGERKTAEGNVVDMTY